MTAEIRLRPISENDLTELQRFWAEPEALGEFEWVGFSDPGRVRRRIEEDGYLGSENSWLVVTTEDGETPAGIVSWSRSRHGKNDAAWCWSVGIALFPEHRGRGIGTRAQKLLASYLFEHTLAVRLEAGTEVDNVSEQRALENAGFQREGVLRSATFVRGEWRDVVLYSRLRTDPT